MIPSLFINHGSPLMALQESDYTRFLEDTGKRFTPKAIVMFSAHWEERVTTISFAEGPLPTIYDFGGFPDELYRLTYPAPGDPGLAGRIEQLYRERGLETRRDYKRGLDHGSWIMLRYMYPAADIPVVTISVNPFQTAAEQYRIGEALAGLGGEDILVIGSGTTVHNFHYIKFGQTHAEPWAEQFDDWLIDKIRQRDLTSLFRYAELAPYASRAVPRAEHFVPLLQAMGSSGSTGDPVLLYRGYEFGTFSYTCFEF